MMKFKDNKGFTLIEIIVALIIIGVLAAIALPNLFSNVQKSKGSAAIAAMDGIKSQIETCAAEKDILPQPGNCDPVSFGLYTSSYGFGFTMSFSAASQSPTSGAYNGPGGIPSGGNLTYALLAEDNVGNIIALSRNANGSFTCSAPSSGPYAGVC